MVADPVLPGVGLEAVLVVQHLLLVVVVGLVDLELEPEVADRRLPEAVVVEEYSSRCPRKIPSVESEGVYSDCQRAFRTEDCSSIPLGETDPTAHRLPSEARTR